MNKRFIFPHEADVLFIQMVINEIFNSRLKEVELDWTECSEITPEGLCLFLNLKTELEIRGITVSHRNNKNNEGFKKTEIVLSFPAEKGALENFPHGIYISAVNAEEEIVMRSETMKRYFRQQSRFAGYDLTTLETLFSELFMNVCQHAEYLNGFIYIPPIKADGTISIHVSDLGIGIPKKIRDYFHEITFENDAACIQYATVNFVTTKSHTRNYGRGLNTLKTSVTIMKGEAEIRSSKGYYLIGKEEKLAELDYEHQGTLISIRLNLNNFEKQSDPDYNEEVRF
jgi:anti-sigma regulatory factor (Ser/Thr protein kinase)